MLHAFQFLIDRLKAPEASSAQGCCFSRHVFPLLVMPALIASLYRKKCADAGRLDPNGN
jgi:hypothetical protein